MAKVIDESTFRAAIDELMDDATRIASDQLSVLKEEHAKVFSERLGVWDDACQAVINSYFTVWSMFSDDVVKGGVFGVVMHAFPWLLDSRLRETAEQVRDTVRWRAMAIEDVDADSRTAKVTDLRTRERLTLNLDGLQASRRSNDHGGTISGFVAALDGVSCIIGPVLYDVAPAGSSEAWRETPLALYTSLLSGAMGARFYFGN